MPYNIEWAAALATSSLVVVPGMTDVLNVVVGGVEGYTLNVATLNSLGRTLAKAPIARAYKASFCSSCISYSFFLASFKSFLSSFLPPLSIFSRSYLSFFPLLFLPLDLRGFSFKSYKVSSSPSDSSLFKFGTPMWVCFVA